MALITSYNYFKLADPWCGLFISTARAFGPAVISGFDGYHWIYCMFYVWPDDGANSKADSISDVIPGLGPTLGAILASAFWYGLKYIVSRNVSTIPNLVRYLHSPRLTRTL